MSSFTWTLAVELITLKFPYKASIRALIKTVYYSYSNTKLFIRVVSNYFLPKITSLKKKVITSQLYDFLNDVETA